MNDIRRTVLWVIFGFSMVLLWDQWQVHNGKPATFFPQSNKAVATAPAGKASAPVVPSGAAPVPSAVPAATAPAVPPTGGPAAAAPAATPRERFAVTTDLLRLTFDTEGGSLVGTELLKVAADSSADKVTSTYVLLDDSANRVYVAQTGLIGGDFPNHKTVMTASGERQLKDGARELSVRFESPEKNGVKLVKTYTVKRGAYDVAVKHEVVNTGTAAVSPQLYLQIVRDGNKLPGESSFYSTFTGPAVYTEEKKYQKIDFGDIEKNKADFVKESSSGYVAMVQHYFASAWILPDGVKRQLFARKVDNNLYAVGMITGVDALAPGASKAVETRFFAGPQEEKMLEHVAPGLDLVKDYGWLTILAKPLYWLLDKIHSFIGNWGWSIMALVLLIKISFYWLQAKGYQSMAKMKAINPRVMAMRERYKDNPQQMQQEMMKIYREEKVNPLGGCFPIMVQIPVFIALYWVLLSTVEMRNAPWIGWIRDLAAPDPYFILPVVMTLTTMLQTALNPAPPDPMQAKMMWIMPLAFSVMFFFFPAGLVLYWITNNVLSIAQQWLINTRMGVPPEFNLPKFGRT
ncbi:MULTISPECIES: membrane protein insertase YidC [Ramlibacter]|uniref:Membrane protein insertase YidC n=1 Tax=Ramlibacter pinisoli TaxID=2682844 RepID=A0A6N8J376_9BURK|nr:MULTISPECIES: membrane protein insertase YidC [Ramlibacter]MBA2962837.1 membrane protein insertase YidC [Ramlibacter sp. CGMCC 1.13660]MVQ32780.1 membrane protein insertase YidC [Ramlibacter pinisoli]